MRKRFRAVLACIAAIAVFPPRCAFGHGFVGDRFFPPTIATDDPFATDELSLPQVSIFKDPGKPATWELDSGFELDKEILPHFAVGLLPNGPEAATHQDCAHDRE